MNDSLSSVFEYQGKVYALKKGLSAGLYVRESTGWQYDAVYNNSVINHASVAGANLLVSHLDTVVEYDATGAIVEEFIVYNLRPNWAMRSGARTYIASSTHGMVRFDSQTDKYLFLPKGPEGIGSFNITSENGEVWVVGGSAVGSFWGNGYQRPAVSSFIEDTWTNFGFATVPAFVQDTARDVLSIAVSPREEGLAFAGTLSPMGLMEFRNNAYQTKWDETNSSLQESSEAPGSIGIPDMEFDDDGNLWMLNMYCSNQLVVRTESGSWRSYDIGNNQNDLVTDIAIGDNGYKWILSPGDGIWVYNDAETISVDSDDQSKLLTTAVGNGGLPSQDVMSIAVDLDGEVWVGTDAGPVVFYTPESIFGGSNFDGQQILIEQDGNLQLLLETEAITAIAIDGGNRKWLGTQTSGVFLMSEDGTTQIHHFTTENSPLLSNEITSITVNGETGEVFFGTAQGLISFRGIATDGDPLFSDVYAYPNPVREDYFGLITIKGLERDSDVKITDVAGRVVYYTTSQGGQAVWDGNNFDGVRAKTGVYLVFATDRNGNEAQVTKILLVN